MESKKRFKKRPLNEYRQVKDSVYPTKPAAPLKSNPYYRFFQEMKSLCRTNGDDQQVGGALRRAIIKHHEAEQCRQNRKA